MAESPRDTEHDPRPTLPRLESTYSRIIDRAIVAAREERGIVNKVRGFTRQIAALGGHTRAQFRALPRKQRAAVSVGLLLIGGALALGGYQLLFRPSPAALREEIQAHMRAKNFLAAKRVLEELSARTGGLGTEDRWKYAAPVQAWVDKRSTELLQIIDARRQARRWSDAVEAVEELEQLGVEIEWALYTHAEILRAAGRRRDAAELYGRYATLFPQTQDADDALFWQALTLKEAGDEGRARTVLRDLVKRYPRSNFLTSSKRMLADLGEPP